MRQWIKSSLSATLSDERIGATGLKIMVAEVLLMVIGFTLCGLIEERMMQWTSSTAAHAFSVVSSVLIAGIILCRIGGRHRRQWLAQHGLHAALRLKDEHVRLLLDSTAEGICAIDQSGTVVYCNAKCLTMLGYATQQAVVGNRWHALVHRSTVDGKPCSVDKCCVLRTLSRGDEGHCDDEVLWKADNTSFPAEYWSHPTRRHGQIIGAVITFVDISERTNALQARDQAEKALRLFRELLDRTNDIIEVVDPDTGRFLDVNQTACKVHGYSREEYLKLGVSDIAAAGLDWPAQKRRLGDARKVECTVIEGQHRRKDGSMFPVEITLNFIQLDRAYVVANVRDITDRLKTEDRLRLLSTALEAVANGIVITDPQGTIEWVNPTFSLMTGYSPEEVKGHNVRILKSERQDALFYKQLWDTILGGKTWRGEVTNRRKDGSLYLEELSISPVRGIKGDIGHFVAIKQDITERKQIEETLRQNEERYRHNTDNMLEAIREIDKDGTVQYASPSNFAVCGYPAAEIIGTSICDNLHPDDVARAQKQVGDAFKTGAPTRIEVRYHHADGHYINLEILGKLKAPRDGEAAGAIFAARDITARKKAEAALHDSEERFRQLAETVQEVFWLTTPDFASVLYVSPAYETIWGRTCESLVKTPGSFFDEINPESCDALRDTLDEAMKDGKPISEEFSITRPDGKVRWISLCGFPVTNEQGTVYRYAGIAQDITERRQTAVKLDMAREAAEAANRAKSEFLAHMSHEIRTPMNGIIGMTELVLGTPLSTEQRDYVDMARQSADSLLKIINDILDFSKIEAGKLALDTADFDFHETLGKTIRILALRAHQKGLELALDIAANVPTSLIGDGDRLRQVIMNLVGNAIKFTDHGEIVIGVCVESRSDQQVELHCTITDTGIGIPRDMQKKLFQAFQQVDSSITRRYGGTGLGLVISARFIQLMGGRIWVDSEGDRGCQFHFTVRLGVNKKIMAMRNPIDFDGLADMRVLIVDDNATNRRIVTETLRRWQMQTAEADSGISALQAIDNAIRLDQPFRLLLIDGHMPGMDGFHLVEELRGRHELHDSTTIMLTSSDQPADIARCRALGVAGHLVKPVLQVELQEAVLNALGSKSTARVELGPAKENGNDLPPPARLLHVLLAEDQAVNQLVAVRMLERRGHTVVVAGDGQQAVDALTSEQFDAIIMDLQMPKMDGFEAMRTIRKQEHKSGHHMPITAMTAHAMKGDREHCLEAGFDGYLSKPITSQELYRVVEGQCEIAGKAASGTSEMTEHEPDAPSTTSIWDRKAMLERLDGDASFVEELIDVFRETCPKLVAELEAAIDSKDAPIIARKAHALKGNVSNLFAAPAFDQILLLEKKAQSGDLIEIKQDFAELKSRLDSLQHVLECAAPESACCV